MAARTGERATLPEAQAEPDEIATPGKVERDQRRRGVEPRNGEAQACWAGAGRRRRTSTASGAQARRPASSAVAQGREAVRGASARARSAGDAEPDDAGQVLGAAAQAPLLAAPAQEAPCRGRRPRRAPARRRPSGPPNLWPERVRASRPSAAMSTGILPTAWTASRVHQGPAMRPGQGHDRSASGWITPVSLLAAWTEISTSVVAHAGAAASSRTSRSIRPAASTGITSTASAGKRCAVRDAGMLGGADEQPRRARLARPRQGAGQDARWPPRCRRS